MLATSAIFANEIWIGNLIPLAPDQVKQSITCAIPCNSNGLSLWMRQPLSIIMTINLMHLYLGTKTKRCSSNV